MAPLTKLEMCHTLAPLPATLSIIRLELFSYSIFCTVDIGCSASEVHWKICNRLGCRVACYVGTGAAWQTHAHKPVVC